MSKADIVLKKVKEWLNDEIETFEDNPIDESIISEEQGILIGRAEVAEGLLDMINKWEGKNA